MDREPKILATENTEEAGGEAEPSGTEAKSLNAEARRTRRNAEKAGIQWGGRNRNFHRKKLEKEER